MNRPLNEQVIVVYPDGGRSHLFNRFVSLWDIREACEKPNCGYEEEHWTYDGQIFFRRKQGASDGK